MADAYIADSLQLQKLEVGGYKTETALYGVVAAALIAAVASYGTSATASTSGYSGQDVNNVLRNLYRQNYIATFSGSTITVSW